MIINRNKTILLVEDEILIAIYEKKILEKLGYKIIIADSGENSIELFRKNSEIDVVLMDINLGSGIDGTEAAMIMLKQREIPIIFLSSHAEPEIVDKTEKITSYGYVTKDSGITVLDTSIKMALKLFDANRKLREELTARAEAEEVLKESELKYHTLFKSMSQGFYLSDIIYDNNNDENGNPVDYRFIDVNSAFETILDLKRDQIIGKTYNELVPPDPDSGWLECFRRVATTGVPESYTFASKIYNCYFETYAFKPDKGKFAALVKSVTDRILAEEKINKLFREKELLVREMRHRIKNNLNMIYSMLTLQSGNQVQPEAEQALKAAAQRIKSMNVLNEKLVNGETNPLLIMQDYIPPLVNEIIGVLGGQTTVRVNTHIADIIIRESVMSLLGLILNELVTNAMKFAFQGRSDGVITISAEQRDNCICIEFEDNGTGLPESISFEHSTGFGLNLVGMLVQQLGGSIIIDRTRGTKYIIEFTG